MLRKRKLTNASSDLPTIGFFLPEIRLSEIRLSGIRLSEIRLSEIRLSEIRPQRY